MHVRRQQEVRERQLRCILAWVQVVHMDMKPKNVLLTADYSIAKIADVGLAHIMGSTPGSPAMGTFAYAAPEQLISQHCDEKVLHLCPSLSFVSVAQAYLLARLS